MSEEYMISNPTETIDVDFGDFIRRMRAHDSSHRVNGIPDYAFALDYTLREKIRKLPMFYTLSKKVAVHLEARMRQIYTCGAVLAGPRQFPDLYRMTVDCAQRLGIGPPRLLILHDQSMNAFTFASDTSSPTVVVHSGIVERLTPGELKCVIGHECGHVHNEHQVYMSICELLNTALSGSAALLQLLSMANIMLFYAWSRAAEVTADRAAMICSDNVDDAINVNKKLAYGTFINREDEVNIDDIRDQFDHVAPVASIFTEIGRTHPSSIRRVLTSEEFTHCETLYQWRPELKQPSMKLRPKAECDKLCEKYTAVAKERKEGGLW